VSRRTPGPLGHGLPVAVGMAKAAKLTGATYRTYVLTGDGEMQEGSNWEAIASGAQFGLDNLTLDHRPQPLPAGRVAEGHQRSRAVRAPSSRPSAGMSARSTATAMDEIVPALEKRGSRPHCIVAHTNKGQGISFMQDTVDWHHKVPSADQYQDRASPSCRRPSDERRDTLLPKLHDCRDAFVGDTGEA
jgi:transketolase